LSLLQADSCSILSAYVESLVRKLPQDITAAAMSPSGIQQKQ